MGIQEIIKKNTGKKSLSDKAVFIHDRIKAFTVLSIIIGIAGIKEFHFFHIFHHILFPPTNLSSKFGWLLRV